MAKGDPSPLKNMAQDDSIRKHRMIWTKEEKFNFLEYDASSDSEEEGVDDETSQIDYEPGFGIECVRISESVDTWLPGLNLTIISEDEKINNYLAEYLEPLCKNYRFKKNEIDEQGCFVFVFPKDSHILTQIIDYFQSEKILCEKFCISLKNKILVLTEKLNPTWLTTELTESIKKELNSETVLEQLNQLEFYDSKIQILLIYGNYLIDSRNKHNIPIYALLNWYLPISNSILLSHVKNKQQYQQEIDSKISFLNEEKKRLYIQGALIGLLGMFPIPTEVIKGNISPHLSAQDGRNVSLVSKLTLQKANEQINSPPLLTRPGVG